MSRERRDAVGQLSAALTARPQRSAGEAAPPRVRASHWLNPITPRSYEEITPKLLRRLASRR